jgi:hypothetical protein
MVHLELDFWLMLEHCDPAGTLPEFNVMAVPQAAVPVP